jgi:hypothetical protein
MLALMRKGIDDPDGDTAEAVAQVFALEREAASTKQVESPASPVSVETAEAVRCAEVDLSEFTEAEIESVRAEFKRSDVSPAEIALRIHARRSLGASSTPRGNIPWLKYLMFRGARRAHV